MDRNGTTVLMFALEGYTEVHCPPPVCSRCRFEHAAKAFKMLAAANHQVDIVPRSKQAQVDAKK